MDLLEIIGYKIAKARKKLKMNQEELGNKVGLSRASIVNIEKGRQGTTIDTLYRISQSLGKDIYFFLPSVFMPASELNDFLKAENEKVVSNSRAELAVRNAKLAFKRQLAIVCEAIGSDEAIWNSNGGHVSE